MKDQMSSWTGHIVGFLSGVSCVVKLLLIFWKPYIDQIKFFLLRSLFLSTWTPLPTISMSNKRKHEEKEKTESTWICKACTYKNQNQMFLACEICEFQRSEIICEIGRKSPPSAHTSATSSTVSATSSSCPLSASPPTSFFSSSSSFPSSSPSRPVYPIFNPTLPSKHVIELDDENSIWVINHFLSASETKVLSDLMFSMPRLDEALGDGEASDARYLTQPSPQPQLVLTTYTIQYLMKIHFYIEICYLQKFVTKLPITSTQTPTLQEPGCPRLLET